jgi:hypothetical protein
VRLIGDGCRIEHLILTSLLQGLLLKNPFDRSDEIESRKRPGLVVENLKDGQRQFLGNIEVPQTQLAQLGVPIRSSALNCVNWRYQFDFQPSIEKKGYLYL